jgi:DNA repair exonuclease SbcCD ATPase subunit
MAQETLATAESRQASNVMLGVLALAVVLALAALVWCYGLSNHLKAAETQLVAAQQKNAELAQQQDALNARLRATTETLAQSVGVTQRQIEQKTQALLATQAAEAAQVKATTAQTTRLAAQQQAASQQISSVASDVSNVKTDVSGAKSSIAETQQDLAQTKQQMQRTLGDMGQMSGLIARTHEELESLKHKGDRNYIEFTLTKGAQPTLLGSIKLQVRRIDEKHSRYTVLVSSDDRDILKKDKSLDEPVQFYSGKDPSLFEIVVNNMSRNTISGYVSTPKSVASVANQP